MAISIIVFACKIPTQCAANAYRVSPFLREDDTSDGLLAKTDDLVRALLYCVHARVCMLRPPFRRKRPAGIINITFLLFCIYLCWPLCVVVFRTQWCVVTANGSRDLSNVPFSSAFKASVIWLMMWLIQWLCHNWVRGVCQAEEINVSVSSAVMV